MKSLHTTAISITLIAFLLSGVTVMRVQEVSMVAQVVESLPKPEKSIITYDFSSRTFPLEPNSFQVFPDIENAPFSFEGDVVSPQCPFVPNADNILIDFTRNRTVPLTALYLHANKDMEGAQHTIPVEAGVGLYSVQLASFNQEKDDLNESVESYDQRWHLLFYDEAGNVLYKTESSRDMYDGELETIELVEQEMVVEVPVSEVQARHTAFPDIESHSVAPLCALLSKKTDESTNENFVELQNNKTLFSASIFLKQDNLETKEYHVYVALTLLLTLFMALGVFVIGSNSRTSK